MHMKNHSERITPLPLYQIVKNDLRQKIITGALRDGVCLPTEKELCNQYGYSRATIRTAIELLAEEDLVIKIRGNGTFVTFSPPGGSKGSELRIDFCQLSPQNDETSIRMLSYNTIEASDTICKRLGIPRQTLVQQIGRLIMVDDAPQAIQVVYATEEMLPHLFDHLSSNASIERALENYGMAALTSDLTFRSSAATSEEATLLSYVIGGPTFSFEICHRQRLCQTIAFSTMTWRADNLVFHAEVDANEQLR
ncbi:transcriptional regulator, GntR family [Coriobacterium glomerans PW2]|uniref:Transcriptional regulator, GntR family n=2 Tax=Coriobacterium TaxID=33870 RepID=F2N798_CORGP|nr:transcriptional regulator, GntR family [Coriobacterium glomerans PW2]